ncbi:hypothetical protein [Sphingomonas sp.]|jgi:crotonobetainyl-CoA:carnitine CoA-transferase CaiB-like acyl-CoA transferase|uniref:hypothetical protein n=1 Tax=Sphingomonas sp. TaxID=28214 RepID=UPI00260D3AEC|nr:hypothetical protein [Sphingomonas sp.]MDF2495320.1 acyl-CoA hydratase [Sphingomonas sp.]
MLRVGDLPSSDYFAERGPLRKEHHPLLAEPVTSEAQQCLGQLPDPEMRPAPLMGEDGDKVLREWLGVDADAIERLVKAGSVERENPGERSVIEVVLAGNHPT